MPRPKAKAPRALGLELAGTEEAKERAPAAVDPAEVEAPNAAAAVAPENHAAEAAARALPELLLIQGHDGVLQPLIGMILGVAGQVLRPLGLDALVPHEGIHLFGGSQPVEVGQHQLSVVRLLADLEVRGCDIAVHIRDSRRGDEPLQDFLYLLLLARLAVPVEEIDVILLDDQPLINQPVEESLLLGRRLPAHAVPPYRS